MAYTRVLKTFVLWTCGFESHHLHQPNHIGFELLSEYCLKINHTRRMVTFDGIGKQPEFALHNHLIGYVGRNLFTFSSICKPQEEKLS